MTKYRKKTSFISKDLEKRNRQLANLKRGKEPGTLQFTHYRTKKLQEVNIIEFATGENWLGLSFEERPAQSIILKSIYGIELNKEELKIYQKLTKNKKEFEAGEEKTEAVLALGARSGKSLLASIVAIYEATRSKWAKYLNKGESGYIVVVSTRQKQSEQIIGANCQRLMENSYNLRGLIKDSTQSELTLKNNMKIISLPCNSTAGRGLPIACLIFDEIAHFYTEGVKADETIFNALRPRQVQFPGCKLIMISTPAAKMGIFFNFFDEGFKTPGRLTAQAGSLFMNPLVDQAFLRKEKKRDLDNYLREFEAHFSEKLEAFFSYEIIVNALRLAGDLPYKAGYQYSAGIDASGLTGRDKFALAISHKEGENIYIDKAIAWDLKDSDLIMADIKEIMKIYNITKVLIDKYAKGWVQNALEKIGLEVDIRPSLTEIFVNLKSLMLGNRLYLPDNQGIKKALQNTIGFYGRNNALSIAHPRDSEGHADILDAIATAVFNASGEEPKQIIEGKSAGPRQSSSRPEEDREYRDSDW